MSSIIRIKNMVCPRCITAVEDELKKQGLSVIDVQLGTAEVDEFMIDLHSIRKGLEALGFELLTDPTEVVVDQVRTILLDVVHTPNTLQGDFKLSAYLEDKIGQPYYQISKLFSQENELTIERYFIKLKIEKAKELIAYNELSVKEIAMQLGYSSVQHFYTQFKQVANVSVKEFKSGGSRQSLDNI